MTLHIKNKWIQWEEYKKTHLSQFKTMQFEYGMLSHWKAVEDFTYGHIDGSVQDCSISNVLAMEFLQVCISYRYYLRIHLFDGMQGCHECSHSN